MSRRSLSSPSHSRAALEDALILALREVSGLAALVGQRVAERLALNPTDLECLDVIARKGPVTAGELARASGLTTGAITGVIDRLEEAGFARRERGSEDRRKVLVTARPEAMARAFALYGPIEEAARRDMAGYADADLDLVLDYIRKANASTREAMARMAEAEPET